MYFASDKAVSSTLKEDVHIPAINISAKEKEEKVILNHVLVMKKEFKENEYLQ